MMMCELDPKCMELRELAEEHRAAIVDYMRAEQALLGVTDAAVMRLLAFRRDRALDRLNTIRDAAIKRP